MLNNSLLVAPAYRRKTKSMHHLKYFAGFALVAFIASMAAMMQTAVAYQNPIKITQCFITQPKPLSKKAGGTQITYINQGTKDATHITFAVSYRNAESSFLRKVTDDGDFQPHATISHHFALYNDVTFAGKTAQCSAISVTWADGTKWHAPTGM